MHVAALWRYPVKSLAGERLDHAHLNLDGVVGDRIVHVRGAHGPLTGRTRHDLVAIPSSTSPDGVPLVAGQPWNTAAADAVIRRHAGPDARLAAYDGPERFDVLNLLVATDGAVEAFGHDVRRLRPNLLLGGVPADAERTWPGSALAIGDALIGVHSMRQRCVVTSIDPDTAQRDPDDLPPHPALLRRRTGTQLLGHPTRHHQRRRPRRPRGHRPTTGPRRRLDHRRPLHRYSEPHDARCPGGHHIDAL